MKLRETRDILAYIEHLHEQLGAAYQALDKNVSDERAHLLLDYLEAMEKRSAEALHGYSRESISAALREWEPAEFDDRVVRERFQTLQHPDVGIRELLDAALDIAEWFGEFYAELEKASTRPEQTELFKALRERAEREKKRLVRNVNMLSDF
jgi:hypothetical protein